MIYLASPYAHPDPVVMQQRFHQVCQATAALLRQGQVIYSPIAHNHYLACNFELPRTWDFWAGLDLPMLELADEIHVLMLDGWRDSRGVAAEITHAEELSKRVVYRAPETLCGKNN